MAGDFTRRRCPLGFFVRKVLGAVLARTLTGAGGLGSEFLSPKAGFAIYSLASLEEVLNLCEPSPRLGNRRMTFPFHLGSTFKCQQHTGGLWNQELLPFPPTRPS